MDEQQFKHECECREWIKRYKLKIKEVGSVKAQSWWIGMTDAMEKTRGKNAVDRLRKDMTEMQRKAKK